jgi:hypothetical protein
MKRWISFALVVILVAFSFSAPVSALGRTQVLKMTGLNDSLTCAASAVYDTSSVLYNAGDYEYIALVVDVDRVGGGLGGAGLFAVEGKIAGTSLWLPVPMANVKDSLEICNSIAMSGAVDVEYSAFVGPHPPAISKSGLTRATAVYFAGGITYSYPFTELRLIITDTNWTLSGPVDAYWILKKRD